MKKILTSFGVDQAIALTLFGKGGQAVAGLVTLWMVANYLTPVEQGFYFTFTSILALQVFFELGLGIVILQFASHEKANLNWTARGLLEGELYSKDRLRSLFRFALRWYGTVALLVLVIVLPVGWLFFGMEHAEENATVSWRFAWVALVSFTAISVLVNPVFSLLEGCGLVVEVAKVRIYQVLAGSVATWLVLAGNGGLLAVAAMSMSMVVVGVIWLIRSKRNFLQDMLVQVKREGSINWMAEIWPLQWKIALSWMSGYFVFQLFTPVLFAYRGAVEAGKMGMSITIATAMMSLAAAWMSTKVPRFGVLIAKSQFSELDSFYFKALWQSLSFIIVLAMVLSVGNFIAYQYAFEMSARILQPLPFLLLMMATVLNYVVFAQAAYLRAHKREPFLVTSVLGAIMVGISTIFLTKDYGSMGLMTAYFIICLLISFLATRIFQAKRLAWH